MYRRGVFMYVKRHHTYIGPPWRRHSGAHNPGGARFDSVLRVQFYNFFVGSTLTVAQLPRQVRRRPTAFVTLNEIGEL